MKNLRFLLTLTLLLVPLTCFSAEPKRITATSRITEVTVYSDRALTSRSAALNLTPGSYLISFENLPALIQDDSVRVEGSGSAGVTIAGIEVKRTFLEKSGEKRVKEIDEEIYVLEQRSALLAARK